jgi:glycosyltransferase involved in cell wall biosynthesis
MNSAKTCTVVVAGPDAGDGPWVHSIVMKLGLEKKVTFTGLVDGALKLGVLHDADVVAHTLSYECFGLVPFEALMCGTPAVVTTGTGCGEVLEKAGLDCHVQFGNVEQLANRLEYVLDNPSEAVEDVAKAQQYIQSNLSLHRVVDQLEHLYGSIVGQQDGNVQGK